MASTDQRPGLSVAAIDATSTALVRIWGELHPPPTPRVPMHIPHVVVDGSNIATEARSLPSLAQLDEAVKAFIAEYDVGKLTVIVDATFGHRIEQAERSEFDSAIENAELVTPPAGSIGRGDAFILQVADRVDAVVLSNDSFQEFHGEYPWLFDEGRLIGGKPVPGVGWVFLRRTPVRGPLSRRSQRDAKRKKDAATQPEAATQQSGRKRGRAASTKTAKATKAAKAAASPSRSKEKASATDKGGSRRRGSRAPGPSTMINDAMPFIEFVGAHPVGSEVEATVVEYSSHGAYVDVDGARCYAPLHALGDPPPTRARDVVTIGDIHRFVVTQLDPPRRGIDVALIPDSLVKRADALGTSTTRARGNASNGKRSAPRLSRGGGDTATTAIGGTASPEAVMLNVEEEQVAISKKASKKAPARKTAKKAAKKTAKKAPARKTAKKATRKAPARKTAKKATKKAAKKTAKKAPARKTAKKAAKKTAKKATKKAAKRTTKKAPARKTAKKAAKKTAKKATKKAAKRTTKKAAKRTTKKAPARKTAKKATRKAPARKAGARR